MTESHDNTIVAPLPPRVTEAIDRDVGLQDLANALMSRETRVDDRVGRFTVADITIRLHYYKQHVNNLLRFQSPEPAVYGVTDSDFWREMYHYAEIVDAFYLFRNVQQMTSNTMLRADSIFDFKWHSDGFRAGYFVAVDHVTKSIIVCIRGTKTRRDVMIDLAGGTCPFATSYAHKGMSEAARLVYEIVMPKLVTLKSKLSNVDPNHNWPIKVIGHSMGAGVGALLTVLLREVFITDVSCVGFAMPPIFSSELAVSCYEYVQSIVFQDDLVARLNPRSLEILRRQIAEYDWKTDLGRDLKSFSLIRMTNDAIIAPLGKAVASTTGLLLRIVGRGNRGSSPSATSPTIEVVDTSVNEPSSPPLTSGIDEEIRDFRGTESEYEDVENIGDEDDAVSTPGASGVKAGGPRPGAPSPGLSYGYTPPPSSSSSTHVPDDDDTLPPVLHTPGRIIHIKEYDPYCVVPKIKTRQRSTNNDDVDYGYRERLVAYRESRRSSHSNNDQAADSHVTSSLMSGTTSNFSRIGYRTFYAQEALPENILMSIRSTADHKMMQYIVATLALYKSSFPRFNFTINE